MHKKVFILFIRKVCISILLFSYSSCAKINLQERFSFLKDIYYFFFPIEEFHPCDPFYNYYENKKHYFIDDLLTEEKNINYYKLLESQNKLYKSPCDPLNKRGQD